MSPNSETTSSRLSAENTPQTVYSREQLDSWAVIIADGRDSFPVSLPEPDRANLLEAVRRRARDRLVDYIARAIAAELHRRETSTPRRRP